MKKIISLAFSIVFAAPVFAQNAIPKPTRISQSVVLQRGLIDDKTVNGAKQVGKSSMYYSQVSGGSALLGLLLGPVGVLVNMAAIEENKERESKSDALTNLNFA